MAHPDSAPWLRRPAAQAVADSTGGTTVTVHCGAWATVAPHLSDEVAAMLAPPIVVSSLPLGPPVPVSTDRRRAEMMRYRMNMPSALSGKHRRTRTG
jgi:hypothetical protein